MLTKINGSVLLRIGAIVSTLGVFSMASAQSLGLANQFNAFVFGNASANGGETEGAVAVGGNFSTTNAHNTLIVPGGATVNGNSNVGLYVKGNLSVQGGQLNNGGKALIGGAFSNSSGPYNLNGGGNLKAGGSISGGINGSATANAMPNPVNAVDFSQQQTYSNQQSAFIAGLGGATNMDALIGDPNNLSINVGSLPTLLGHPGVKLLRTNATSQAAFQNLLVTFNNFGSNTLLIDVVGSGTLNWKWKMNSPAYNRMLWNFNGLTQLNVSNDTFGGSILAPHTRVVQERVIRGNLIASSWELRNGVEMWFGGSNKFDGYAPVPEPATMATLAVGALGLIAKRRKRGTR